MGSFNFTSFYNSVYSKTILNQLPSQPSTSCATLGILEILFFPTEGTIRLSLTHVPIHVIRHFRFCIDNQTPLSIYSSSLPRPTKNKTVPPSSSLPIRQLTSYHVQIQAFNPITFFSTTRTIIFISILLCDLFLYLNLFFAVNAISCSNIYI